MGLILESPGPILWQWGWLQLRWYGVLIGVAILLGLWLAQAAARRRGWDPALMSELLGWLMIGAIPAARLYYVLFEWPIYRQQPWWKVLAIWQGGIAIHGALLGGMLAIGWFARYRQLNFWQLADTIIPSVILGQAIGRWGNFFNNEAYGGAIAATSWIQLRLPNGSLVHPTFFYESLWNLGVFVLLLRLSRRPVPLPAGSLLAVYLIAYSLGRFWIEGLRTDSLMLGPWRVAQGVSLLLIGLGSLLLWQRRRAALTSANNSSST
ncbi:MAG: prolipoprotein diacylglyceryl transferase [Cyanobacteriota bacterium]|nr:prolipoprotein diacylglyceryl transferase [Cyanobacteriota bacterium]